MDFIKKYIGVMCASMLAVLASVSPSFAALDLLGVTFPMADIESVASLILAAAAGIWVIYKVLTLIRKG